MKEFTGSKGAYASGGRPPVGQPVLVGENGPEMVVFDQPGTVVPNDEIDPLWLQSAGYQVPDGQVSLGGPGLTGYEQYSPADLATMRMQRGARTPSRLSTADATRHDCGRDWRHDLPRGIRPARRDRTASTLSPAERVDARRTGLHLWWNDRCRLDGHAWCDGEACCEYRQHSIGHCSSRAKVNGRCCRRWCLDADRDRGGRSRGRPARYEQSVHA